MGVYKLEILKMLKKSHKQCFVYNDSQTYDRQFQNIPLEIYALKLKKVK